MSMESEKQVSKAKPVPNVNEDLHSLNVKGSSGVIVSVSAEIEELLGLEPGTLVGKNVALLPEILPKHDQSVGVAQFISEAGHDFLEPLNTASSLAGLFLMRHRGEFDEEAIELVRHLQAAAERMRALVQDAQSFLDVCRARCDFAPVDMNDVFAAALLPHAAQIKESHADVKSEELPLVFGCANLLITLLSELLGNALKFRQPETFPVIRVLMRERRAGFLVFVVQDNGLGIDPEHRESLFCAFKKLHGKKYAGLGLGLTSVKRIVELHHGSVWIETTDLQGTAVSFMLPAA
jgi:light-regulated signal transduction histidine kinase (bacteriophytochrome)